MNDSLRNVKGFKDYLPREAKRRRLVLAKLSAVFEKYGFEPLETPSLEYAKTLEGKYGTEEKLIYKFQTPGEDWVALKYDQTVPLARVISQYGPRGDQLLTVPFKRFQIQSAFRGENTQKGRYREFLQCDVDIIGVDSPLADAEVLTVAIEGYRALGLEVEVLVNDRQALHAYDKATLAAIDKLKKIGKNGVIEQLTKNGKSRQDAERILDEILKIQPTQRIREVELILKQLGVDKYVKFDPTLVRGLDYYTGIIIEVVPAGESESSSMGGGGRWDEMIGKFCGLDMPAVGFSFGIDRTIEAMDEHGLFARDQEAKGVLVALTGQDQEANAIRVWRDLTDAGVKAEIWLDGTVGLDKQYKYADGKNLAFVAVVEGPDLVKLKNLATGEVSSVPVSDVGRLVGAT